MVYTIQSLAYIYCIYILLHLFVFLISKASICSKKDCFVRRQYSNPIQVVQVLHDGHIKLLFQRGSLVFYFMLRYAGYPGCLHEKTELFQCPRTL